MYAICTPDVRWVLAGRAIAGCLPAVIRKRFAG